MKQAESLANSYRDRRLGRSDLLTAVDIPFALEWTSGANGLIGFVEPQSSLARHNALVRNLLLFILVLSILPAIVLAAPSSLGVPLQYRILAWVHLMVFVPGLVYIARKAHRDAKAQRYRRRVLQLDPQSGVGSE